MFNHRCCVCGTTLGMFHHFERDQEGEREGEREREITDWFEAKPEC